MSPGFTRQKSGDRLVQHLFQVAGSNPFPIVEDVFVPYQHDPALLPGIRGTTSRQGQPRKAP
jgi:hypothetical protein